MNEVMNIEGMDIKYKAMGSKGMTQEPPMS